MIRYLTAGESHGPQLDVIIDGFPSNFKLDVNRINRDLAKRQIKLGSGKRMSIETDQVVVNAGIMDGKTTGSPLSFSIKNFDHANWKGKKIPAYTIPRPGHADFGGVSKYGLDDIRKTLERASARETATRVILGSCCMQVLEKLGIEISTEVFRVGDVINGTKEEYEKLVFEVGAKGDTVGGCLKTVVKNVPVGLGSYAQPDRRLDAKIAATVMSIPSVKGIEFGAGYNLMTLESKWAQQLTGGIDGGVTNGQPIVFDCCLKPIPTAKIPQDSVDLATGKKCKTKYERSDVAPIFRASIIVSSMVAYVLLNEIVEACGGDDWRRLRCFSWKYDNEVHFDVNEHAVNRKKKEFWKK